MRENEGTNKPSPEYVRTLLSMRDSGITLNPEQLRILSFVSDLSMKQQTQPEEIGESFDLDIFVKVESPDEGYAIDEVVEIPKPNNLVDIHSAGKNSKKASTSTGKKTGGKKKTNKMSSEFYRAKQNLKENGGEEIDSTEIEEKTNINDDGQVEQEEIGLLEALDQFRAKLERFNVFWLRHPNGDWNGYRIYTLVELEIPGLELPENKFYFRKLDSTNVKDWNWLKAQFLKASYGKENIFTTSFFLRKGCDNPIKNASYSSPCEELITVKTGESGTGHKVIPSLDWFPDSIKAYTLDNLFPLFDPAELSTFTIHLGRALVGSTGKEIDGKPLEHTYRTCPIIVSPQSGIGKSVTMQHIMDAMELLGYTVHVLNPKSSDFGNVEPATADFCMSDDMNRESLRDFFKNPVYKVISSNGRISLPVKFQEDWKGQTQSALMAMINDFSYGLIADGDTGMLSRFHFLRTTYRSFLPLTEVWGAITKETGLSRTTIAVYALALCYLEFIKANDRGMAKVMEDNQKAYIIQVAAMGTKSNLVELIVGATTQAIHEYAYDEAEKQYLIACMGKSILSAPLMACVLSAIKEYPDTGIHFESTSQMMATTVSYFPKCMLHREFIPPDKRSEDSHLSGRSILPTSSSETDLKSLLASINTITGIMFDNKLSGYQLNWKSCAARAHEKPKVDYGLSRKAGRAIIISLMSSVNSPRVTSYYKPD